jgi:hypothetical protein
MRVNGFPYCQGNPDQDLNVQHPEAGAMTRDAKPLTALPAPLTPRKSEIGPAAGCVPVNCGGGE